jgi:hypothetical protein
MEEQTVDKKCPRSLFFRFFLLVCSWAKLLWTIPGICNCPVSHICFVFMDYLLLFTESQCLSLMFQVSKKLNLRLLNNHVTLCSTCHHLTLVWSLLSLCRLSGRVQLFLYSLSFRATCAAWPAEPRRSYQLTHPQFFSSVNTVLFSRIRNIKHV